MNIGYLTVDIRHRFSHFSESPGYFQYVDMSSNIAMNWSLYRISLANRLVFMNATNLKYCG